MRHYSAIDHFSVHLEFTPRLTNKTDEKSSISCWCPRSNTTWYSYLCFVALSEIFFSGHFSRANREAGSFIAVAEMLKQGLPGPADTPLQDMKPEHRSFSFGKSSDRFLDLVSKKGQLFCSKHLPMDSN